MKRNKENHVYVQFALNSLAASMLLLSGSVYALEAMNDADLRTVNGQDGIAISTSYGQIDLDQVYWEDHAGSATAADKVLRGQANTVKIKKSTTSSLPLGTNYRINTGSEGNKTGLDLTLESNPSLITIDEFKVCDTAALCSPSLGRMAVQTTSPIKLALKTKDGLFNNTSQSELNLAINNANIYVGQISANNELNQLILKNFNFNFAAKGTMFVDSVGGLRLQTNVGNAIASTIQTPNNIYGYVDLNRVKDSASANLQNTGAYGNGTETTNAGLNLEVMLSKNVNQASPYALDVTNSPENAKGLIRVGASGRMVNGYLQLRGVDGTNNTLLGNANSGSVASSSNSVLGKSGIAFRMRGEFTKENDSMLGADGKPTTLEIGGAGLNSYGFEFGNLTGLNPETRGYFDSGNVYLNLVDTKSLLMPSNYVLQNSRLGSTTLTTIADYTQNIHSGTAENPYALAVAIRGAEFQAFSRRGRFTTSANVAPENQFATNGLDNQWGLAIPVYNLNANLAIYGFNAPAATSYFYTVDANGKPKQNAVGTDGTTPRLGFSVALGTEGVDKDASNKALGNKTTSILVIDGSPNANNAGKPTDYYMGLRNIDLYLKGAGSIGLENGSINLGLKDMLLALSAEIAAGYLPGAKYKTCPSSGSCNAPIDNFAKNNDVLFGLKLRLGGDLNLSLIPQNSIVDGSALRVVGDFTMPVNTKGNTVQITDPIDGSALGLDNLVGKVAFNSALVVGKEQSNGLGKVSVKSDVYFNPDKSINGVFRARDINFYPPSSGAGARLGELAITGGRLSSNFSIVPRNGSF